MGGIDQQDTRIKLGPRTAGRSMCAVQVFSPQAKTLGAGAALPTPSI